MMIAHRNEHPKECVYCEFWMYGVTKTKYKDTRMSHGSRHNIHKIQNLAEFNKNREKCSKHIKFKSDISILF